MFCATNSSAAIGLPWMPSSRSEGRETSPRSQKLMVMVPKMAMSAALSTKNPDAPTL